MADIDITLTDNTGKILQNFDKGMEAGLEAIGLQAERYAKENCPVDTGRLRNSITHTTAKNAGQEYSYTYRADKGTGSDTEAHRSGAGKNEVYVGTNVEYALAQETNDYYRHTVGRAHFLRDAAADHGDTYKKILENQLKSVDK